MDRTGMAILVNVGIDDAGVMQRRPGKIVRDWGGCVNAHILLDGSNDHPSHFKRDEFARNLDEKGEPTLAYFMPSGLEKETVLGVWATSLSEGDRIGEWRLN